MLSVNIYIHTYTSLISNTYIVIRIHKINFYTLQRIFVLSIVDLFLLHESGSKMLCSYNYF